MFIRLISYDFPWAFDLDYRPLLASGSAHYVTCGDVWMALTTGLAASITDAEWAMLLGSRRTKNIRRKRMICAIIASRAAGDGKFGRRVDWLGRNVMFRGLQKDDKYAQEVLLPGREFCPDTYVMRFDEIKA